MIGCLSHDDNPFSLEKKGKIVLAYNTGEETSLLVGFT